MAKPELPCRLAAALLDRGPDGVAVGFEGNRIVVCAPNGRRQLREGELARALARQREEAPRQGEEIASKDGALASKDAEIAVLRRRLAELGRAWRGPGAAFASRRGARRANSSATP